MQSSLLPESRQNAQQNMILFVMLITGVFLLQSLFMPPPKKGPDQGENANILDKELDKNKKDPVGEPDKTAGNNTETPSDPNAAPNDADAALVQAQVPPTWISLGSLDPESPYRMLVTLTNQGAAVSRIELNEKKYHDVQDPTGYLGQIVADLNHLKQSVASIPDVKNSLDEKDTPNTKDAPDAKDTPEIKENSEAKNIPEAPVEQAGVQSGCLVQVVGSGTPAEKAGLKVNDRIVGLTQNKKTVSIHGFSDLRSVLLGTKPGDQIELAVERSVEGKSAPDSLSLPVVLGRCPINITRPLETITTYEQYHAMRGLSAYDKGTCDQLSYLCTLSKIDDQQLEMPKSLDSNPAKHQGVVPRDLTLDNELPGVNMRHGRWELVQQSQDQAVFRIVLPKWKLAVTKTFQLAKRQDTTDTKTAGPFGAYHLNISIEVKNLDSKERTVAYMLDGPTGMPLEGGWYPRKTGPGWGIYGIRDVVVKFKNGPSEMVANTTIASDKIKQAWKDDYLDYIGVDTQYFQSTIIPVQEKGDAFWHSRSFPIRVGEHNADWTYLTDITFRTYSVDNTLKPGSASVDTSSKDTSAASGSSFSKTYTVFAGPKKPDVLSVYGLDNTIAYGWFWFVAKPMLAFLHFIKTYVVFHYGLAIIVLTVCVRLLMFPMSRKQAINAAKNAMLMPEMQKIKEQYKGNLEAQSKAQHELWKKHNFNPLSGCLGVFIQIPIFIGLYKSLSVDVELYGTPLISESFGWCRDLSAPDMLFDWSGFWNSVGWATFNTGQGMLALGPYFNLLPMLTISLFIVQQAIMMPPPTDENSRMQQQMMKYMMIFMGLMFFKVPSGLCVYFIASSLWGLAERKLIPKYEYKLVEETFEAEERGSAQEKLKEKPKHPVPSEKEQIGIIGEMWKKLTDKASEPRTLHKSEKSNKKKKKK